MPALGPAWLGLRKRCSFEVISECPILLIVGNMMIIINVEEHIYGCATCSCSFHVVCLSEFITIFVLHGIRFFGFKTTKFIV